MPMPKCNSRINVAELKFVICEKVGPERALQYFSCLERFLSQKLSKYEFDKLCFIALGEENVPLHNHLIRAIVRNAHKAKSPPPPLSIHGKDELKPVGVDREAFPLSTTFSAGVWSNGEILSPRKCRSGFQDRKHKDNGPSPLGIETIPNNVLHQRSVSSEDFDIKGILQSRITETPFKRPRTEKPSQDGQFILNSDCAHQGAITDNMEKGHLMEDAYASRPLLAPLGILLRRTGLQGSCRQLASGAQKTSFGIDCHTGGLCQNEDLKKRMDQTAKAQGLGGVSLDCASLLNKGLDSYLTRLIKSCVQLVGSRSGYEQIRTRLNTHTPRGKIVNGLWQDDPVQLPSRSGIYEVPYEIRDGHLVSLQDFKVAMQLNPQQLGEDWPFLLEKVCVHSFDE